jgi:hypothetical protein
MGDVTSGDVRGGLVWAALCGFVCACGVDPVYRSDSPPAMEPRKNPAEPRDRMADNDCGKPCGECGAGVWTCGEGEPICQYPTAAIPSLRETGLKPGQTGARPVFHADDFAGSDDDRLRAASDAAGAVGGAVVLDRMFLLRAPWVLRAGVLYTGGGVRRECTPVATVVEEPVGRCVRVDSVADFEVQGVRAASDPSYAGTLGGFSIASIDYENNILCAKDDFTFAIPVGTRLFKHFHMVQTLSTYEDDIVIDSVLFDGGASCNAETHDWRYNNNLLIRGKNTIKNSVFVDMPSENMTICGATVDSNVAANLQGSFVHKSCSADRISEDVLRGNYVEGANLAGDLIMDHSEGVVTLSANSQQISLEDNVFRNGGEGVFGNAGPDDQGIHAYNDCYAHFKKLINIYCGADPQTFTFKDTELIDVGGN